MLLALTSALKLYRQHAGDNIDPVLATGAFQDLVLASTLQTDSGGGALGTCPILPSLSNKSESFSLCKSLFLSELADSLIQHHIESA